MMSCPRRLRRAVCVAVFAAPVGSLPSRGQDARTLPDVDRMPRFFVASDDGTTPIDAGNVAALRRRINVAFERAPVTAALSAIAQQAGLSFVYSVDAIPSRLRVSFEARGISAGAALVEVLAGTNLDVVVADRGQIALVPRTESDRSLPSPSGIVHGTITDSAGAPLSAAEVAIESTPLVAVTGDDGGYRLPVAPTGRIALTVRRLGHRPQQRVVVVRDGRPVRADFALRPQVTMLDKVVVAGSLLESRLRSAPMPVAVLSERQIQTPTRNRIDMLFRGEVPGIIGYDLGAFGLGTMALVRGRATLDFFNLFKVYVDGVETPAVDLTSAINLHDIERGELLRGPQGATIYGSNASGGVLLLFTKTGRRGGPQLSGSLAGGAVKSVYVDRPATLMEHRLNVSGGGDEFNYSLGAAYDGQGEIVPEASTSQLGTSGRVGIRQGPLTLGFTGARSNRDMGIGNYPDAVSLGIPKYSRPEHLRLLLEHDLLGASASYARLDSRWRAMSTVGWTRFSLMQDRREPRRLTAADTLLDAYHEQHDQLSLRLVGSSMFSPTDAVTSTLTAGMEFSERLTTAFWAQGIASQVIGSNAQSTYVVAARRTLNRGYFIQNVVGVRDRLFVTTGVRAEINSSVGRERGTIWAPRAGIAYASALGTVVIKPRISYGVSIRPPAPNQSIAGSNPVFVQLANPGLRPEVQRGYDAGLDADVAHGALGLELTYFDQTADDLISAIYVASTTPPTQQYQNLGRIGNRGIELGASAEIGPFDFRGSFTVTHSRILELAGDYRGSLRVGDEPRYVARRVGGGTAGWRLDVAPRPGRLDVGVTYIGARAGTDDLPFIACYAAGKCTDMREYWTSYPGFAKVRAGATVPVAASTDAFVNVDNLFDREEFELRTLIPSRGRAMLVGIRFGT